MEPSTASSDATPSPVTLASLPAELHSVIATMAQDQDKRYTDRLLSTTSCRRDSIAKAGATEWDGRSLNALFLVSKGWSKVASA